MIFRATNFLSTNVAKNKVNVTNMIRPEFCMSMRPDQLTPISSFKCDLKSSQKEDIIIVNKSDK